MAAKKFLIVKLLIVLAAAGGLAWWIAVGPAVNIDRTYDGVLWRSHDASLCAPVTVHVTGTMDRRTFSGDIVVEGADLEMTGVRAHMKNGHAFLDKVPHDYIDQPYLAAVLQTGRFSSFVLFVGEPDSATAARKASPSTHPTPISALPLKRITLRRKDCAIMLFLAKQAPRRTFLVRRGVCFAG